MRIFFKGFEKELNENGYWELLEEEYEIDSFVYVLRNIHYFYPDISGTAISYARNLLYFVSFSERPILLRGMHYLRKRYEKNNIFETQNGWWAHWKGTYDHIIEVEYREGEDVSEYGEILEEFNIDKNKVKALMIISLSTSF